MRIRSLPMTSISWSRCCRPARYLRPLCPTPVLVGAIYASIRSLALPASPLAADPSNTQVAPAVSALVP